MTRRFRRRRSTRSPPVAPEGRRKHARAFGDLEGWIKRFLTSYLPQHSGASSHTVSSYGQALRSLLRFLAARKKRGRRPTFSDLAAENVLAFLARLEKKRGNSPATRNARLAGILSFLRFAFLVGAVDGNSYERMRHIAFKRGTPAIASYLEVDELDAIFHAVNYHTRDGFRDLVVLKLLYNTGARASEIASLRVSDLELAELRVAVTGKGGKRRLCGLWETTVALVRIYLASERRAPKTGFEDRLFISQRRKPLTRFGIHDIVRRHACKAAEYCPSLAGKRVTPHTFRHTTGVHLTEAGVDMNTIRDWLGHAHMQTTEIYARVNLRTKRLALGKLRELDRKLFEEIATGRGTPGVEPAVRRWLEKLGG